MVSYEIQENDVGVNVREGYRLGVGRCLIISSIKKIYSPQLGVPGCSLCDGRGIIEYHATTGIPVRCYICREKLRGVMRTEIYCVPLEETKGGEG
jgi:hypothetical protein